MKKRDGCHCDHKSVIVTTDNMSSLQSAPTEAVSRDISVFIFRLNLSFYAAKASFTSATTNPYVCLSVRHIMYIHVHLSRLYDYELRSSLGFCNYCVRRPPHALKLHEHVWPTAGSMAVCQRRLCMTKTLTTNVAVYTP